MSKTFQKVICLQATNTRPSPEGLFLDLLIEIKGQKKMKNIICSLEKECNRKFIRFFLEYHFLHCIEDAKSKDFTFLCTFDELGNFKSIVAFPIPDTNLFLGIHNGRLIELTQAQWEALL